MRKATVVTIHLSAKKVKIPPKGGTPKCFTDYRLPLMSLISNEPNETEFFPLPLISPVEKFHGKAISQFGTFAAGKHHDQSSSISFAGYGYA